MSCNVVLFDIDGTLLSSAGAGKAALEKSMASRFGVEEIVDGLTLSGRTDLAILHDLFRMHEIPFSETGFKTMLEGYLEHLPECLKSVQGKVLPGIDLILEKLAQDSEFQVGLLTGNLRKGAKIKLGHFGINEYFSFGGFGDFHLDRDDVAREALKEVQERFGSNIKKSNIWVIGDTPLDIRCARAIGVKVMAVATGWHGMEELRGHSPDALVENLSDADGFIKTIMS
ncbi:MAG: hypothetical protein RIR17_627 [Planctomycetota bacterium]